MKSLAQLVGTRLVPALITAAGVVLLTAGLLSYADPATAGIGLTTGQEVVGTLVPSDEPPIGLPSPSPVRPGSPDPGPSGSSAPTSTPGGSPASSSTPGRAVATRVVVPALGIDLPVVKGNEGYPYCNVAMYLHTANSASKDAFGQPGEGKATYLYAHARDGMFGPIYELAIQRKNPGKMVGMTVEVYTSDFKEYVYEIREHRLHVTDLDAPLSATEEELWLQTSEGPKGTAGKTQLRAVLRSVSDAGARESTPRARPVKCG